jgi:nucleoside-diphosphate-sugar epimerase
LSGVLIKETFMKILVTEAAGFIGSFSTKPLAAQAGVRYSIENPRANLDDLIEDIDLAPNTPLQEGVERFAAGCRDFNNENA